MNEIVQDLFGQCISNQISTSVTVDNVKFANLLVDAISEYLIYAVEVHSQREQDVVNMAAQKIKEKFKS